VEQFLKIEKQEEEKRKEEPWNDFKD